MEYFRMAAYSVSSRSTVFFFLRPFQHRWRRSSYSFSLRPFQHRWWWVVPDSLLMVAVMVTVVMR